MPLDDKVWGLNQLEAYGGLPVLCGVYMYVRAAACTGFWKWGVQSGKILKRGVRGVKGGGLVSGVPEGGSSPR